MFKRIIYLVYTIFLLVNSFSIGYTQSCNSPKIKTPFGNPGNQTNPTTPIQIPVIHGIDPNIIIGPKGYDTVKWISSKEVLPYKILFENDPELATGPVQTLTIYLPIDKKLEPTSVRLGSFGFGNYVFSIPPNSATYSTRLDLRDSLGIYVDVLAGVDFNERQAFWIMKSIDPQTGLPPDDAFAGFLPVNDTTDFYNDTVPKPGEGFVNYSIKCSDDVETGDSVKAQAGIVFDFNAPVITNTWVNIVDAKPPTSKIEILSHNTDSNLVVLKLSGEDDFGGVGLSNYSLYVSEDGNPFYLFKEGIDSSIYSFDGGAKSYCFFSTARDFVGNSQPIKSVADDCIILAEKQKLSVKSLLEGPYSNGEMLTTLNQQGVIPTTQPYNTSPWNYAGIEQVDSIPSNIVDWVLVSLRTSRSKDSVVATTAALLRNDGQIVGVNDSLPSLTVPNKKDSFYVVVYHRNHLGVMSATPLSDTSTIAIDFTKDNNVVYGGQNGIKDLGDGNFGMFSGDVDANGQIQNVDLNIILPKIGLSGYRPEDTDMNNQIQNTDVQNKTTPNVGRGVPFDY